MFAKTFIIDIYKVATIDEGSKSNRNTSIFRALLCGISSSLPQKRHHLSLEVAFPINGIEGPRESFQCNSLPRLCNHR